MGLKFSGPLWGKRTWLGEPISVAIDPERTLPLVWRFHCQANSVRCRPTTLGVGMRRREFITVIGGAAAAWPIVTRAQQHERVRRIGVLMHLAADDPEGQSRLAAFLQGLQEAG